jgi:hypothetical protein
LAFFHLAGPAAVCSQAPHPSCARPGLAATRAQGPAHLPTARIALTRGGRQGQHHLAASAPEAPDTHEARLAAPAPEWLRDGLQAPRGAGKPAEVAGPTRLIGVGPTVRQVPDRPLRPPSRLQLHTQLGEDIPGAPQRCPQRRALTMPAAPGLGAVAPGSRLRRWSPCPPPRPGQTTARKRRLTAYATLQLSAAPDAQRSSYAMGAKVHRGIDGTGASGGRLLAYP